MRRLSFFAANVFGSLGVSLLALAAATPAWAITFASGQGTDSAVCGTVAKPCRTLQGALNVTPPGGYVVLQGPSDFGRASVNKSVSIIGEAGATLSGAGAPDQEGAILVDAGANDVVRLRGLTITNAPHGGAGVLWVAGKSVELHACRIRQTSGAGVMAMTTQSRQLVVVDSDIEASYGVWAGSQSVGLKSYFDAVRVSNAAVGLGMGWSSAPNSQTVMINSSVTNAAVAGLRAYSGDIFLRNSVIGGGQAGLSLSGSIHLSRSAISGAAVVVEALPGDGALFTYGDNVIRGNADETLRRTLTATYR